MRTIKQEVRTAYFLCFFFSLGLLFNPSNSAGFTTVAGGETISWDFQGIPSSNFFSAPDPCSYRSDANYWVCNYGIMDPPYGNEITFTASITPTQGAFPGFDFGYYDISDINHYTYERIKNIQWALPSPPVPLTFATSFYIPARAGSFTLFYSSDLGNYYAVTKIQMNFQIANYDPCRANLQGGDDINPDSDYCDESTQPGKPRMRKYHNKKGTGPGR
jgi:hypothetical protein